MSTTSVPDIVELFPEPGRVIDPGTAPSNEVRQPGDDRPWVMTNMISSLDGATAVEGLSGGLGGPADRAVFLGIRAVPDVIIVGAATATAEKYRPPAPSDALRAARRHRGQTERPAIAVVSRTLSISPDLPLFGDPTYRPIILTGNEVSTDRTVALAPVADVVQAGTDGVDLALGLQALGRLGHRVALLEGGPRLNGQFIAANLVDEWNLSTAPLLIGGDSRRLAVGPEAVEPARFGLDRLWTGDGLLFSRWLHSPVTRAVREPARA